MKVTKGSKRYIQLHKTGYSIASHNRHFRPRLCPFTLTQIHWQARWSYRQVPRPKQLYSLLKAVFTSFEEASALSPGKSRPNSHKTHISRHFHPPSPPWQRAYHLTVSTSYKAHICRYTLPPFIYPEQKYVTVDA